MTEQSIIICFVFTLMGLLILFPIRSLLVRLLFKSAQAWSVVCLIMILILNFFGLFLFSVNDLILYIFMGIIHNGCLYFTFIYIYYSGTRWLQRVKKHSKIPFHTKVTDGGKWFVDGDTELEDWPMHRFLAGRSMRRYSIAYLLLFVSHPMGLSDTFAIIYLLSFLFISGMNIYYLICTIKSVNIAFKNNIRWFVGLDEKIARKKSWFNIDRRTGEHASGDDATEFDYQFKNDPEADYLP